jgi:hypothetical protein
MGNGLSALSSKRRRIDCSIAHNDDAARGKVAAVAARRHVFPGNRASADGTFTPVGKETFERANRQNEEQALSRTQIRL